jgi:ferrous iron transport protein A
MSTENDTSQIIGQERQARHITWMTTLPARRFGVSSTSGYSQIYATASVAFGVRLSREGLEVQLMALSEIAVGGSAVVASIELPHEIGDHLMHLGFLPDATIDVLRRAPAGDPTVYRVEGAEIALRRETACHIFVRQTDVPQRENV